MPLEDSVLITLGQVFSLDGQAALEYMQCSRAQTPQTGRRSNIQIYSLIRTARPLQTPKHTQHLVVDNGVSSPGVKLPLHPCEKRIPLVHALYSGLPS